MKDRHGKDIVSPLDSPDFFSKHGVLGSLPISHGVDAYIVQPYMKAVRRAAAYTILREAVERMTDEEKHALFEILPMG